MKIDNIPIGTTILITIQVLVYLVNKFLYRGRLMKWGEGNSKAVFEDHEYWRLISAAFLHTKLYHIAANVIILVLLLDWLLEDYGCGCSFCYYTL